MSAFAEQKMKSPSLRRIPFMGVIHVVTEAMKLGYDPLDPKWSNLGQGQPEVGILEGAPKRISKIELELTDHGYGPVEGTLVLRERVANHLNRLYRQGKKSQYTAENIVVAPGGRTALTRLATALNETRLGYFVPDYSAYEDLLNTFKHFTSFEITLDATERFSIAPEMLKETVIKNQIGALLISNPCNPTGKVISGDELAAWTTLAREQNTTLLLDEFYSHYIYEGNQPAQRPVSAAAHIEDVNEDPVFLVDGLTKNYRYPGWRVGWIAGPKEAIVNLVAAGSFIDGGPSRPVQKAALEVLEPARADQETQAVRDAFSQKRNLTVERLKAMGVTFPLEPEGTFYAFGSIENLPAPLNNDINFFKEALKHQVLTVPGTFFDVNPNKNKKEESSLGHFVRFSYGPPRDNLENGLDRLEKMIAKFK